jgi:hypothetical protein
MRKAMLSAAMLAMVLAAAAPAFAQTLAVDEGDDTEYNAVCQNIVGAVGDITQDQDGDASATADEESAAAAEVAQEQGVSVGQVNECLNEVEASASTSASASASASASTAANVQYAAGGGGGGTAAVLPETGGASLLALGAGALLVAGGLVARRIVR